MSAPLRGEVAFHRDLFRYYPDVYNTGGGLLPALVDAGSGRKMMRCEIPSPCAVNDASGVAYRYINLRHGDVKSNLTSGVKAHTKGRWKLRFKISDAGTGTTGGSNGDHIQFFLVQDDSAQTKLDLRLAGVSGGDTTLELNYRNSGGFQGNTNLVVSGVDLEDGGLHTLEVVWNTTGATAGDKLSVKVDGVEVAGSVDVGDISAQTFYTLLLRPRVIDNGMGSYTMDFDVLSHQLEGYYTGSITFTEDDNKPAGLFNLGELFDLSTVASQAIRVRDLPQRTGMSSVYAQIRSVINQDFPVDNVTGVAETAFIELTKERAYMAAFFLTVAAGDTVKCKVKIQDDPESPTSEWESAEYEVAIPQYINQDILPRNLTMLATQCTKPFGRAQGGWTDWFEGLSAEGGADFVHLNLDDFVYVDDLEQDGSADIDGGGTNSAVENKQEYLPPEWTEAVGDNTTDARWHGMICYSQLEDVALDKLMQRVPSILSIAYDHLAGDNNYDASWATNTGPLISQSNLYSAVSRLELHQRGVALSSLFRESMPNAPLIGDNDEGGNLMPPVYRAVRFGPILFVITDPIRYQSSSQFLGPTQLAWIKNVFSSTDAQHVIWAPTYPTGSAFYKAGQDWQGDSDWRGELTEILDELQNNSTVESFQTWCGDMHLCGYDPDAHPDHSKSIGEFVIGVGSSTMVAAGGLDTDWNTLAKIESRLGVGGWVYPADGGSQEVGDGSQVRAVSVITFTPSGGMVYKLGRADQNTGPYTAANFENYVIEEETFSLYNVKQVGMGGGLSEGSKYFLAEGDFGHA